MLDRGLKRETVIDSMRHDEKSMLAAVDLLRRKKPTSLIAYTQSCAMWARASSLSGGYAIGTTSLSSAGPRRSFRSTAR